MFTGEATPNLGLPQWEGGDHPEWLTDMNPAFKKIDESIGELTGTANEANKLIKEIIPIVTENTEKITSLDTREESDRAYLQQQVDTLKNADLYIHGILDAMQVVDDELKENVKDLDRRLKEEEGTTAGFSSAAGNTVMDYYNRLKTSLENHVIDYTKLVTDFQAHVDDWDTKYTDLNQRLTDVEQDIPVLDNRITALEDWKSPFAQQVAELEERFGVVDSEFVNLKKSFAILQDNVNELDTAVHQLESGQVLQDAEIEKLKTQIGEVSGNGSDNTQNIEQLKADVADTANKVTNMDTRLSTLETQVSDNTSVIADLQSSVSDTENKVQSLEDTAGTLSSDVATLKSNDKDRLMRIYNLEQLVTYVPRIVSLNGNNNYYYGYTGQAMSAPFTTVNAMFREVANFFKQRVESQPTVSQTVHGVKIGAVDLLVDELGKVIDLNAYVAIVTLCSLPTGAGSIMRTIGSGICGFDTESIAKLSNVDTSMAVRKDVSFRVATSPISDANGSQITPANYSTSTVHSFLIGGAVTAFTSGANSVGATADVVILADNDVTNRVYVCSHDGISQNYITRSVEYEMDT